MGFEPQHSSGRGYQGTACIFILVSQIGDLRLPGIPTDWGSQCWKVMSLIPEIQAVVLKVSWLWNNIGGGGAGGGLGGQGEGRVGAMSPTLMKIWIKCLILKLALHILGFNQLDPKQYFWTAVGNPKLGIWRYCFWSVVGLNLRVGNLWIQTPTIFIAKNSTCKWTLAVQTPVVQGSTALETPSCGGEGISTHHVPSLAGGPLEGLTQARRGRGLGHSGTQSGWHTIPGRCVFGGRGLPAEVFPPPGLFDSQRDGGTVITEETW